jgi:hypothetical protein
MTKILPPTGSFILPEYKRTGEGRTIDGVVFNFYRIGISRYGRISADGKIFVRRAGATWHADVIDHGGVLNERGVTKFFRSDDAACREAVKIRKRYEKSDTLAAALHNVGHPSTDRTD